MAGGPFSGVELFGMTIRESANDGSDFTNPSADYRRLFLGEDAALHTRDSAGTVAPVRHQLIGCFVYNSTTQSFAATTLTTITFNSEVFDTSAMHDTGSNTGRLVAPITGYYRINAGLWYATTSGTNYILLDKNGGASYIRAGATAQNGGGSGLFISTPPILLTAADYITVVGYHTEAGTIATGDTGSTISQQNYASMELVGV